MPTRSAFSRRGRRQIDERISRFWHSVWIAITAESRHDPQTEVGRISPLLTQQGSADRTAPEPGHVRDARRRREARACDSVLQAALTRRPGTRPRRSHGQIWKEGWREG